MSDDRNPELRQRAERLVGERREHREAAEASRATLHELEVHQAELEIQNETLRKAENELEDARDRYFELFDLAPVAYVTLARDGTVVEANLAAAALLDVERRRLVQRPLQAFVSTDDADRFEHYRRTLLDHPTRQGCEISLVRTGGVRFPVRLDAVGALPTGDGADQRPIRMAVIDLTEIHEAKEQARQAQKMEAIGTLASGIAHDFNNLLMGIGGCADIAAHEIPEASAARPYLEEIKAAVASGAAISRQLLALGRGKGDGKLSVCELDQEVASAKQMLRRLLGEDIRVVARLDARGGRLCIDRGKLQQVLLNLAVNARDAMPHGGELTIETGSEAVAEHDQRSLSAGEYVTLTVSDTGVGMSEQTKERIFEPFFSTKEPGRGTGLGLSTVYGIVKAAGGHIDVRSEPDRGSTFRILLPATRDPVSREPELPEPEVGPKERDRTILLVEDERAVRRATRVYLEQAGYRALSARSGPDALERLERYRGRIDLLLTDVILPGLSGSELAGEVQRRAPDTAVIYMSAHSTEQLAADGRIESGVTVLQKPFSRPELLEAVGRALDTANAGRALRDEHTTVLLVDDEEDARITLGALLRARGYEVLEAKDGANALETAEAYEGPIDVLLADIRLPDRPGREVASRLRQLRPELVTLFISGFSKNVAIERDMVDEGEAFIEKPADAEEIQGAIERILAEAANRSRE